MTEEKRPVDHALDLFVYAPLGLALEARALFPKLIDRGRQQVNGQVSMAKVVGQFAVRQGQAEGRKQFSKMSGQAQEALAGFGLVPPPGADQPSAGGTGAGTVERPEPPVEPKPGAPIADAPDGAAPTVTARRSAPARVVAPPPPSARPAPAVTLAIPDYDSLAASQVIPRLAGLADDELEAVRAYESAKRGRKTILNRVAQLQVG